MSAKYELYKTPTPQDTKEIRYHARLVVGEKVSTKTLAKIIASRCTLKEADVRGSLIALSNLIIEHLQEGDRIHIEGLGYFQISVKSPVVKNTKAIRAESIRFNSVKFLPEKELKRQLAATKFTHSTGFHRSSDISKIEQNKILTEHFKIYPYITCKEFARKCKLTPSTALRRLQELIAKGRLTHPGYRTSPFYFQNDNKKDTEKSY